MPFMQALLDWFLGGSKIHGEGDREIVWPAPPPLSYPGKLTKDHFKAACDLEGVFEFEPGPGATLPVGEHVLVATFLPLDPEIDKKTKRHKFTVAKASPSCTWRTPSSITEGTALGRKQLNAACVNLPGGDYEYIPPNRHQLTIGRHTLKCVYTPAHEYSRNYDTLELEIELDVVPMEVPIVNWTGSDGSDTHVDSITYGDTVGKHNIYTAACATTEGRFEYDPEEGHMLQAGKSQSVRVTFHPTNRNRYKRVVQDMKLDVVKATPVIDWASPERIYVDTLSSDEQLCATNDLIPNTHAIFKYDPPLGSKLPVGENTLSCTFTADPNIVANYEVVTVYVTLVVIPKKEPIIQWPAFERVGYGEEISRDNIANAKCNSYMENDIPSTDGTGDPDSAFCGAIKYEPVNGTILEPGTHKVVLTFTPSNTVEYDVVLIERDLFIDKAMPEIVWETPADMLKNLTLCETQLNAAIVYDSKCSSRVKTRFKCKKLGSLSYDPPFGTLFHAGPHDLTVTFTPVEKHDHFYQITKRTVALMVIKREPTIEWEDPPVVYLGHELSNIQLNAHCTEIEGGRYEYDPPHETILPLGCHTVTMDYFVDPDYDNDYQTVRLTKTISVAVPRQPNLTWENPPDINYNTPLQLKHLKCKCDVYEGFLLYEPPKGTILEAGYKHTLKCTFTPNDPLAWTAATKSVEVMVVKADPELVWDPPKEFYAGMKLQLKQLCCCTQDLALADGNFSYKPGFFSVMSEGTHDLTASYNVPKGWRRRYNDVKKTIKFVILPKIQPDFVWKNSSHLLDWDVLVFGEKLSNKHLNATCDTCPGTIVYDPPLGTLLNATEKSTLSVKFTPDNLDKYLITKVTRDILIKKAVPVLEWKPKLPFMYVGKPLEPHTLNAYTTSCNAELQEETPIKGKYIYCPEVGNVLEIGTHCMTTIFEPCKEVSHNYTFAMKYVEFLVIKEGTLFKIPKRYTEPEVRPQYKGEKDTLVRPFEGPKGDFYFSEVDTIADSDRTRRIIEAREEGEKRKAMELLEAVVESKSREASREGGARSPQKR